MKKGDRVRNKATGKLGTVTMGGQTIVQVKFDGGLKLARFVKDLEVVR